MQIQSGVLWNNLDQDFYIKIFVKYFGECLGEFEAYLISFASLKLLSL